MEQIPSPNFSSEHSELRVVYRRGMADSGSLPLRDYAESLRGWHDLFEIAADTYIRAFPEIRASSIRELVQFRVVAERPGSYETIIEFALLALASGTIGNRGDAALVWSLRSMFNWVRDLISGYITTKSHTTNIDEILNAVKILARARGIELEPTEFANAILPLLLGNDEDREAHALEDEDGLPKVDRSRVLIEQIDQALRSATRPLDGACEEISVIPETGEPILQFNAAERGVIVSPLSLSPPTGEWIEATIRFERINRKTGRALFLFEGVPTQDHSAHYSKIVDASVHEPANVYTQAFNADQPLRVWMKQRRAEKGRLNLLWEVTVRGPEQPTLFGTHTIRR